MVLSSNADIDAYLAKLDAILATAKNDSSLFRKIVDAPFTDKRRAALFGLGITAFLLVDKKTKTIDRIALSNTDMAEGAVDMSVKPFHDIKIPLNYHGNFIAEAIRSGRYQCTSDWAYILSPDLSPEEARLNQAGGSISCTYVYPLNARDGGAMIFSHYISLDRISPEQRDFMFRYCKLVSKHLNRLNS